RMTKDCLIRPAAQDQLEAIAAMADVAIAAGPKHKSWIFYQFSKGLSEFRLGRFATAAEWMQKVAAAGGVGWREAQADMVLAMAQHHLGKTSEARTTLTRGLQIVTEQLPTLDSPDLGTSWGDILITHFLKQEAENLIQVQSAPKP